MKRLKIVYDGMTLFDGEVSQLTWTDGGGVKVEAKTSSGGGLLDMLTGLSKAKTDDMVEQKRADYQGAGQ